jgi:hypothetical protein
VLSVFIVCFVVRYQERAVEPHDTSALADARSAPRGGRIHRDA